MNAWSGLMKKEFRLGLTGVYWAIAAMLLVYGLLTFLTWKFDEGVILFVGSFVIVILHTFYLPAYLVVSIYMEKDRMHMWLHNPQSGYSLLLAKFLSGLVFMFLSLLLASLVVIYSGTSLTSIIAEVGLSTKGFFVNGINVVIHVIGLSLYYAVWGVFLWTISLLLRKYLGKLQWLVFIPLIIIVFSILLKWESSALFSKLTNWGAIPLEKFIYPIVYGTGIGEITIEGSAANAVYIGTYAYYTITILIIFFIAGWIIDRKVEV